MSELSNVPGFERLEPKELAQLEALMEKKRYTSGTAIFFQDDPADALYILTSGSAKIFKTSEDGKDRIIRTVRPGQAFGDLAMIEGRTRYVTVQALEDCEALRLSRKEFEDFGNKHSWLLWALLRSFAQRIRQRNEDMLDLSYRDVPYRLLHALAELVERHGVPEAGGTKISMPLSAVDLAAMIGTTPDAVGRLLERYQTEGLIKQAGPHWVVTDPKALTKTLEYVAQQGV